MSMKKILFNGLGNRGWIGGLYYLKNIIFSCLQSEEITKKYRIVVLIDPEHADIFTCFGNLLHQIPLQRSLLLYLVGTV